MTTTKLLPVETDQDRERNKEHDLRVIEDVLEEIGPGDHLCNFAGSFLYYDGQTLIMPGNEVDIDSEAAVRSWIEDERERPV